MSNSPAFRLCVGTNGIANGIRPKLRRLCARRRRRGDQTRCARDFHEPPAPKANLDGSIGRFSLSLPARSLAAYVWPRTRNTQPASPARSLRRIPAQRSPLRTLLTCPISTPDSSAKTVLANGTCRTIRTSCRIAACTAAAWSTRPRRGSACRVRSPQQRVKRSKSTGTRFEMRPACSGCRSSASSSSAASRIGLAASASRRLAGPR